VYRFEAEVWIHRGTGPWHFVTVPPEISDEIRIRTAQARRGFGSVRVRVAIGESRWETSLFPAGPEGYVLPLKKAIRDAGGLAAGDRVAVAIEVLDPH
jgi:hypothetical protein